VGSVRPYGLTRGNVRGAWRDAAGLVSLFEYEWRKVTRWRHDTSARKKRARREGQRECERELTRG